MQKLNPATHKLGKMLTYMRPANSKSEKQFILHYIDSISGMKKDDYGNRYIQVGASNCMFSCHTDTVHHESGFQKVHYDPNKDEYFVESSDCLGADCTVGVWLMLEMIKAKKAGLYVFHREEEIGGAGSVFFAGTFKDTLLKNIKQCVALDRKGFGSVITNQCGQTASDQYGLSLAAALNACNPAFSFDIDPTGTFTDSANYIDIIPECTNLSVGYFRQHSKYETQCLGFAIDLLEALLEVDFEALPIIRSCSSDDSIGNSKGYYRHGNLGTRKSKHTKSNVFGSLPFGYSAEDFADYEPANEQEFNSDSYLTPLSTKALMDLVKDEPEIVTYMLQKFKVTEWDIDDCIKDMRAEIGL